MTTARARKKIKYTRYHNGIEVAAELQIDDTPEFRGLIDALEAFHVESTAYFKKIADQRVIDFDKQVTTLDELFITDAVDESLKQARDKLYAEVEALSKSAATLRKPTFWWFGAEPEKAKNISDALNQVGKYVKDRINDTPWHIQVDAKMAAMRELRTSPESFLQVHNHNDYSKLNLLNHRKNSIPKDKLDSVSTISKQVKVYVEGIKEAVDKFNDEKSKLDKKIKAIEADRNDSPIRNFFVDLFWGEDKKLSALKSQFKNVEIVKQQSIENIDLIQNRIKFHFLSLSLLQNPKDFSDENMIALHAAIDSLRADKKEDKNINAFVDKLQANIIANTSQLSVADNIVSALSKQWMFLIKRKNVDSNPLSKTAAEARTVIKDELAKKSSFKEGLEYIAKLENVDKETWIAFDVNLYDEIQIKKQQFKRLELIQTGWDALLDDDQASKLSVKQIEEFIEAQLWLDTPNSSSKVDAQPLHLQAKEKINNLKESILNDLNCLFDSLIDPRKKLALKNRLAFITQANAMYTTELGELRKNVIEVIKAQLQSELSVKKFHQYLTNFREVFPEQVQNDSEIQAIIEESKLTIIKKYLSDEQAKLLEDYKTKLEFLVSSKRDLLDILFEDFELRPLREEKLDEWRRDFNEYIRRLRLHAFPENDFDANDKEILTKLLEEMILKDYQSIFDLLEKDLNALAKMKNKKELDENKIALRKIDDIFGCKESPELPVSINMFMLRFVVMAQCQYQFANSKSMSHLGAAGQNAVRLFHHTIQDSGKFTTGVVANLGLDELNAMYFTLGANPDIQFSNANDAAPIHLKNDIIGRVGDEKNTQIEVPRYLLLKQVLELILADFDAILRGETADKLEDRLKFALPKLEEQITAEMKLNSDSTRLREYLKSTIQNLNHANVGRQYSKLISNHISKNIPSWDKGWGVLTNQNDCEAVLLEQLKSELNDLMATFSHVQSKDISTDLTEEDVKDLNLEIQRLRTQKYQSEDDSVKIALEVTIQNLVKRRDNISNTIANTQLKALCVEEYRDFLVGETANKLKALIKNSDSLRELIHEVNPDVFSLFKNKALAQTCIALKQNIQLDFLFKKDDQFKETRTRILEDLENSSVPVLNIVRALPRSLTREFPSDTAEMIHQLQYRFADYFQDIMSKLLDKSNVALLNETIKMKTVHCKNERETQPSFFENLSTLFHSKDKKPELPQATAEEHLKVTLKGMEPDLVKKFLSLLPVELRYLHEMVGRSAPMAMVGR